MVVALIEWKENFNVGIAEVDFEHREMVGLINALHDDLVAAGDKGSILEFFGEIYARIAAHFALEEKFMRERKYDQYEAHKRDHERLLDEIRDLADDYEDAELFNDAELSRRLTHWFVEHFKYMDARLHKELG
jgi:hemerythrin